MGNNSQVGVAALMASVAVLARPQFYPRPLGPLLRGYPPLFSPPILRAECAVIGCLDQSLGNIGASIISGVNGTLIGAGTGLGGIINGTNSIRGGLQTIGETIGGRGVTRRLCPVQAYPGSP